MSNVVLIGSHAVRRTFVKLVLSETLCPLSYVYHSFDFLPATSAWHESTSVLVICDAAMEPTLPNTTKSIVLGW